MARKWIPKHSQSIKHREPTVNKEHIYRAYCTMSIFAKQRRLCEAGADPGIVYRPPNVNAEGAEKSKVSLYRRCGQNENQSAKEASSWNLGSTSKVL